MNCPSCRSSDTRRSYSRSPERLARILFARKMYRCWGCGRRFGIIAFNPQEDSATVIVWALIVVMILLLFLSLSGRLF
jgi:transcriptional regulator NrdR family protein